MDTKSPYTFKEVGGNVEVFNNGQRISTGTASAAERYGYTGPTVKTSSNPLGIVGSADVSKQNATSSAITAAANSMTGNNPPPATTPVTPMSEFEKEKIQLEKDKLAYEKGVTDRAEKALSLSYNAGLAKINNQYKALKDELAEQYQTDMDYALEAVTAANPYGAVIGGDQSLKNYKDKITQKYNKQALLIESKMSEAQLALESENYEGYSKIVNEVEKSKIDFNKEMFNFKLEMNKQATQKAQFDATLETKYTDDYRSYLTSVPYSPEEISGMSDEEIMSTTAGRLGAKAGLTAEMVRRDMGEASYKSTQLAMTQANQESLAMNRDRMFALALAKLADKQTEGTLSEKTYTLARAGENKQDVIFAPYTNLKVTENAKVRSVLSGVDLINQAEELYAAAVGDEYSGFGAGVASKIKGVIRTGTSSTGIDQAWQAYLDFLDSNKAPIAKGLKGEVGNLAEAEQKDALKAFPGRFTSPANADKAFAVVRRQSLSHLETLGETATVDNPAPAGSSIRMTGPQGTFDVPADQVDNFKNNGYKQI